MSPSPSTGGVMISVPPSSKVDRGFEPRSGQIKDYKIGICCFSAKHASLRRKNKDWFARNQNYCSLFGFLYSVCRLLSFCLLSVGHCVVCPSSVYGF
jgi:hypothetical protein